ncbi:hypothetical protein Taro_025766, partial [Colocasia esculenta]|nr:hypothetical protein [Colocasia esculenta]
LLSPHIFLFECPATALAAASLSGHRASGSPTPGPSRRPAAKARTPPSTCMWSNNKAAVLQSPMRMMQQMLDTVDQLFEEAIVFPGASPSGQGLLASGSEKVQTPWDIREEEDTVRMQFDMSGLSKEEVKVSIEDDVLVIQREHKAAEEGKKEGEEEEWWRRNASSYDMRLLLSDNCDKDKIRAELKNEVLMVTVPKAQLERKVIDVEIQ